tara:strand:+ start:202 stop:321 length:120 start_codon:yes stop_codon:yes gene_type:complete
MLHINLILILLHRLILLELPLELVQEFDLHHQHLHLNLL